MNKAEALRLLNLPENATDEKIRSSYLELSKKYHPDKNKDAIAHEAFLMIKKAYDYLITPTITKPTAAPTRTPTTPPPSATSTSTSTSASKSASSSAEEYFESILKTAKHAASAYELSKLPIKLDKLQDVCKHYNIASHKISSTTHIPVKKTKEELWKEI